MKAKLAYLRFNVMSSFWFLPGLLLVGAVALSFLTLRLDRALADSHTMADGWVLPLGADGVRLMLSTIAGSMITVTSLVFSMTLVTLTMASGQLGPRLLRTFMQDKVNQVVLGVFIATFAYALLILRTVHGEENGAFLPSISGAVAIVLSIASVGLLIFFIHHIATSIQADTVVANVARQLDETIDDLLPKRDPRSEGERALTEHHLPPEFEENARAVTVTESGYIETVDYSGILELVSKHDLVARIDRRAGHFVIEDTAIGLVWPAERATDDVIERIAEAVVLGRTRTPAQDVEYAEKALVEVALRALSPGINDEFTAIACIDRLGGSLSRAMQRPMPPAVRLDAQGKPRLFVDPLTFEGLFDSAFNQIRQAGRDHVAITIRLVETLTNLAAFIRSDPQYQAIRKHRDMIARACAKSTAEPVDRDDIAERLRALDDTLRGWNRDHRTDAERAVS